jgi:hypothetical protein
MARLNMLLNCYDASIAVLYRLWYLSFHPLAQFVVHALKAWLAAPVLLTCAEVTKNIIFFNGSKRWVPGGT